MRLGVPKLDRATRAGFLAILAWSTTVALARSLSEQVGPLTTLAVVFLTGGGLASVWQRGTRFRPHGLSALPAKYLYGCGVLFVFYMGALFLAIARAGDRQQVLEIGLVNYLWPALTILLSVPLLHKRARPTLLPATLMAVFGVGLVLTQGSASSWSGLLDHLFAHLVVHPVAYLLALFAALVWALYSNLVRRWAGEASSGGVPLFMLATGLLFLSARLVVPEVSVWTLRSVVELVGFSVLTTTGYFCWDLAMRQGNMVLVAAGSYFTPLLSTVVSCVYLGVSAGTGLWIGCLFIVLGALWSWRSVVDDSGHDPVRSGGG
ncbi:MAG: aromatic amino acid DMT transporter YddG [bacterium]